MMESIRRFFQRRTTKRLIHLWTRLKLTKDQFTSWLLHLRDERLMYYKNFLIKQRCYEAMGCVMTHIELSAALLFEILLLLLISWLLKISISLVESSSCSVAILRG